MPAPHPRTACHRHHTQPEGARGAQRALSASVLPLLGLVLRDANRARRELDAVSAPPRDRVLHEVRVVAGRIVVRARVRAAALLAPDAGLDHAKGGVEHVAELDRLREVAVEDLALVLDVDVPVALAQVGEDLELPHHLLLLPEDAEVLEHRLAELVADLPRPLAR